MRDCRHVVTARHVVDGIPAGSLGVGLLGPDVSDGPYQVRGWFEYRAAEVVADAIDHDLALLQFHVPGTEPIEVTHDHGGKTFTAGRALPLKLDVDFPTEGCPVATSGFPLNAPALVTTAGHIASGYAPVQRSDGTSTMRLLGDLNANPGNSGGPVYSLKDGRVLGVVVGARLTNVVTASDPDGSPDAYYSSGLIQIVPSRRVIEFIDRHASPPE